MKRFDLAHIPVLSANAEPVPFDERLFLNVRDLEMGTMAFEKEARVWGEVSYGRNTVVLGITIAGAKRFTCSRCLAEFRKGFEQSMVLDFQPNGVKHVDAWREIVEELKSDAPISAVCREDCKGLCAACGTDLNAGECNCRRQPPAGPFAALRHLRLAND